MEAVKKVEGRSQVLDRADVDTDQIVPKQFLKRIERSGFGEYLFYDWRREGLDLEPGRPILVAGRNFGCGSSREHAVWALAGVGVRAVVSSTFADIFRGNALGNGMLPIQVSPEVLAKLMSSHTPDARVTVNLEQSTITLPDGDKVSFPVPPFSKYCLLNGIDEMGFLLGTSDDAAKYEAAHRSSFSTLPAAAGAGA